MAVSISSSCSVVRVWLPGRVTVKVWLPEMSEPVWRVRVALAQLAADLALQAGQINVALIAQGDHGAAL